jgi:hypothetical protein
VGSRLANPDDAARALLEPTARGAFWGRQPYASLLEPEAVHIAPGTPRSPAAYVAAVSRQAAALPPERHAAGLEALAAVRALDADLRRVEEQTTLVARGAEPQEDARLEARLAALGPTSPGEPAERREMRDLLERQIGLLRGLAERAAAAEKTRSRRLEQMRQLWLEVSRLGGGSAGDDVRAAERLRVLCRDVAAELSGESAAATATLASPGDGPRRAG